MEQEQPINEQESLFIIQQMIDAAKQEQKDDGKGWIIWGWLLFLTSVLTVVNVQFKWFHLYLFWNIFGIITMLVALYEIITKVFFKKKERVKTYTKEICSKLNIGFFISLIFIIIAINVAVLPIKGFALLMNLYGFWILIYGTVLNFKPSIIGAFITWTLGFIALFQTSFQVVMLLHAGAVLFGYIIPGHIANKKFNEVSARNSYNKNSGV